MKTLLLTLSALAACHVAPQPAPPGHAVTELAAQRGLMIDWIRQYREAGIYPTDASGKPSSVFMDERGVRCPMADLIFRSGHADLADAVAREHNTVRLADIKEGPLLDWMLSSGLTQQEIAMVQGAMEMDYSWLEEANNEATILARGQVRGRLEVAERALRDGTQHSLDLAAARLPGGKVPVAKISGKVVPKSAMTPAPVTVTAWRPRTPWRPATLGRQGRIN